MRKLHALLLLIILALLISACGLSNQTGTPPGETQSSVTATLPAAYPYPYPDPNATSSYDYSAGPGYPVPESTPYFNTLPDSLTIPTPEAGKGQVIGQTLTPGPGGEPFYGSLYLARTVESDQEGFPPIVAFSEATDPVAIQDKTGSFLFSNVEPGTYALVVWSPVSSTVIQKPDSEDYLLVAVKDGETTDLGILGIP